MEDCSVCCLTLNKSSRKEVKCPCGYKSCTACAIHYIKDTVDAHCMNCKVGWTREFLDNNFTKVFLNKDYKLHRQNILFDRERSMLPETQRIVCILSDVNKLYKDTCSRLEVIKEQLELEEQLYSILVLERLPEYNLMENIVECTIYEDKMNESSKKIVLLKYEKKLLDTRRIKLNAFIQNPDSINQLKNTKKEKTQFVRACPANNCKGFLSTAWKCGLCRVNVCNKCHEIKQDDDHVCNEDTVKTVELMKQDTRNCPKCAANIFKINGCNQIWCTQCHTAFDFKTGAIETHIHNPHYYEYLRQNGQQIPRAIGDNPGGGNCELLDIYTLIYNAGDRIRNRYNVDIIKLEEYYRFRNHIEHVEIPKFQTDHVNNLDLRVKYMLNEIDETHFKELLQQREKKNQKKNEFLQVINMYQLVSRDILLKLRDVATIADVNSVVAELDRLLEYFNKSSEIVGKRYKCVPPKINYDGRFFKFLIKTPKKTD
jgi:hypothetical protein